MVCSIRAVSAVVLCLSLGGCKDKPRGDESGGAAPLPAGLSADAFCDQVMGAPMRDIETKCSGPGDGGALPEEGALLVRQVTSQVNACKQMLTPRVEAARLTLPLIAASACSKAIQADPWKDALAVRGIAWYLAHEKACQGAIVGNQGEGAPCQLHIECKPGLSCRMEPGAEEGICAQAPGVNAPCTAPRYPALAAEARGACASGLYCNFETTTESAYARASVKPGVSSISPALEGAFLDPEPSAPQTMWGEIGDSFGVGGLGLSGIGAGDGGRGEGIGLGTIGTFGHGSGTGDGQGYGNGHGRLGGSHRTKPPQVRMGALSVSGRLPPEVIQRIVRQNFGRFRLCYEQGLRNSPELHGTVSVRFVIGRDGSVAQSSASGDLPDKAVRACVSRTFLGLSFPQPEGGIVTVTYPIIFAPGDATQGAAAPDAGASDAGSADAGASAVTRGPAGARNVCVPLLGDGGSCWESWQCADGLQCRNGQCGKGGFVAADGGCKEHTDCEAGSFCRGTCKARKKAGEPCQASVECQGACSVRGVCIALCGSG